MARHLQAVADASPEREAAPLPTWARAADVIGWVVFVILLICLAVGAGFDASFFNDFFAINGDWQAYNPPRRLLAGQVPYKDFSVYLGAGELYTVAGVLALVGNTFANSMFATNFLTFLFFELFVFACAVAVFGGFRHARLPTALMVCFTMYVRTWSPDDYFVMLGTTAGNSNRMIRAGGMVLGILIIQAILHARRGVGATRSEARVFGVVTPILAGALIPWSNDMGVVFYGVLSLHYAVLYIACYSKGLADVILAALKYVAISVAAFLVSVFVVSLGHPLEWFSYTMGVASYQGWFYDPRDGKLVSIFDARLAPVTILLIAVFVLLCLRARRKGAPRTLEGSLLLTATTIAASCILWNYAYTIGNRNTDGLYEGIYLSTFMLGTFTLARLALDAVPEGGLRRVQPLAASFVGVLAMGVVTGFYGMSRVATLKAGHPAEYTYYEKLDAWLTDACGVSVAKEAEVVGDGTVWSTYAGALEVQTDQFQPSGTDYIIHVLGDEQRAQYLSSFEESDPDYVVTPSPTLSAWSAWVRNSGWWFYRLLYRDWEPSVTASQTGNTHTIWTRSDGGNALDVEVDVTVTKLNESVTQVTLTTSDPTLQAVADVRLTVNAGSGFAVGGLSPVVYVNPLTELEVEAGRGVDLHNAWYVPADSTQYVPVTIKDGVGTVELTTMAAASPTLDVSDVVVEGVYPDFEYTTEYE